MSQKTAYWRGYERGKSDALVGYRNDAPLSGEWAGESIPELLGDLIKEQTIANEKATVIDIGSQGYDAWQSICDSYENGYFDGNMKYQKEEEEG